jgi:hypothetical protein
MKAQYIKPALEWLRYMLSDYGDRLDDESLADAHEDLEVALQRIQHEDLNIYALERIIINLKSLAGEVNDEDTFDILQKNIMDAEKTLQQVRKILAAVGLLEG